MMLTANILCRLGGEPDMSTIEPSTTYVCILSDHNVAETQAVLLLRPTAVIGVMSSYPPVAAGARRWHRMLSDQGFEVVLVGEALSGNDYAETVAWCWRELAPRLLKAKAEGHRLACNLTGGTKVTALALRSSFPWDEFHYTAFGRTSIEVWNRADQAREPIALPALEPLEQARLYVDYVKQRQPPAIGSETARRAAGAHLAQAVHAGDPALIALDRILGPVWFAQRAEDPENGERESWAACVERVCRDLGLRRLDKRRLEVPVELLGDGAEGLRRLFAGFAGLDHGGTLALGDDTWTVPNRIEGKKTGRAWADYLAGGWFEEQVVGWIRTAAPNAVCRPNIQFSPSEDFDGYESDILVQCAGSLYVCECKVTVPGDKNLREVAEHLESSGQRLGKTRLVFIASEAFERDQDRQALEHFRFRCNATGIEVLIGEDQVRKFFARQAEAASRPAATPPARPQKAILAEVRKYASWQESAETRQKLADLEAEFTAAYPEHSPAWDQALARGRAQAPFQNRAYQLGCRNAPESDFEKLCAEAREQGVDDVIPIFHRQFEKGRKAYERKRQERHRAKNGGPLSTVRSRSRTAKAVRLPPQLHSGGRLPPPPDGLHANDLRALAPAPAWTVLIDETGSRFDQEASGGRAGRFVALVLPDERHGLVELPDTWHAVDADLDDQDRLVQAVLEADCGVLGITLGGLPPAPGERWVDGIAELMDWVLRLLPVSEPTSLRFLIEQRGLHAAGVDWGALAADARRRLVRAFPERGRAISLSVDVISKTGSPLNGYVDAIAFTWGSQAAASRARCKAAGWPKTCLWMAPSAVLRDAWDAYDRGVALAPALWSDLVASADAREPASLVGHLLATVAAEARADTRLWGTYLAEAQRHATSKAIDLARLGAEVDWLAAAAPTGAPMPAPLRLAWLTAHLARSNHLGAVDTPEAVELEALASHLLVEDARLVCHADLHRAVAETNRFAFAAASRALERWRDCDPAVPGLRYWAQVRSSLGQHAAFSGDQATAVRHFDQALAAFARLSDGGGRDIDQTGTYRVIALMDDPTVDDATVRRALAERVGEPAEAAGRLAVSEAPADKYHHHLLLRWLAQRGDAAACTAYLDQREHWSHGEGHPWPLIECYRGLLVANQEPDAARDRLLEGAALAFMAGQGPVVRLIGAVCRTLAHHLGEAWPQAEAAAVFDELTQALPLASERMASLSAALATPAPARELLAAVLPFNFR